MPSTRTQSNRTQRVRRRYINPDRLPDNDYTAWFSQWIRRYGVRVEQLPARDFEYDNYVTYNDAYHLNGDKVTSSNVPEQFFPRDMIRDGVKLIGACYMVAVQRYLLMLEVKSYNDNIHRFWVYGH